MSVKPKSHLQKQDALKKRAEKKARQREIQKKRREAESRLIFTIPKKVRNLADVIDQIFEKGNCPAGCQSEVRIIYEAYNRYTRNQSDTYKQNIRNLMQFLHEQGIKFARYPLNHPWSGAKAVCNLAHFLDHAVRPLEGWKVRSHNSERQIASLMRHLYCKYEVPTFFDKAWYSENYTWMEWFIWVGQGNNIRKVTGLPVPLSKRQAHHMMQAPRDFDIPTAIRYGQLIDMGANEYFVRHVMRTRAGTDFSQEEFWFSVFRWFMVNPMLDANQYGPIIDYIFNQKFVPSKLDENGNMVCPQPGFSMKDRDPESLMKAVEKWHRHLGRERGAKLQTWPASGLPGLVLEMGQDKNKVIWTVRELCTQNELNVEGRTMQHCASCYGWSCSSGRTSIWALESIDREGTHKHLTLEVNNKDRKLVQARGKRNCMPTQEQMQMTRRWCQNAMLAVSNWLI
jgi:PcfJ-like protein